MSKILRLHPEPALARGTTVQRRCTLELTGGHSARRDILYFEYPAGIPLPPDDEMDSFATAAAMMAMAERCPLQVRGTLCETLVMNLTEYGAAWNRWVPLEYGSLLLEADRLRAETAVPPRGTVAAFSGGVDAMFLVWGHHTRKRGAQSRALSHCMFVHGFDIPLDATDQYAVAYAQAQRAVGDLGLPLLQVTTNFRKVVPTKWPHVFAAAVAASFHGLSRVCSAGLIGSSEPYDRLNLPWGAGPITDHLLSSQRLSVIHDGAAFNRTEKALGISDWEHGLQNLRVCWEGQDKSRNCGRCEKCVRTQLNFAVNEKPVPASLGGRVAVERLARIKLKNAPIYEQYMSIYRTARSRRIRAPWVAGLRRLLVRERLRLQGRSFWLRLKPGLKVLLGPALVWRQRRREDRRQRTAAAAPGPQTAVQS